MRVKRLKPKPLEIAERQGFRDTDLFYLSRYGEYLANLICNVEEPLVTILDGPWGSGKTIFARQWAGLMRQRGACVIYFDAFASDHYEDPLIPLTAEILSAIPEKEKETQELRTVALNVGKHLLPVGAELFIRWITGGFISSKDLQGILKSTREDSSNKAGLIIEKTLKARLDAAEKEKLVFKEFRDALKKVAKHQNDPDSDKNPPLVFIVDELDRCQPTFAIKLIERVKHLFSVPGVQFLLIAHLPQLEEAIGHCYGLGLGAKAKIYLEKFYDVRVTIPEDQNNPSTDRYVRHLWEKLGIDAGENHGNMQVKYKCFDNIALLKKISLRTIEKIMSNIALAYSLMPQDGMLLRGEFWVEGLCIIRHLNPELYSSICSGGSNEWDLFDLRLNLTGKNAAELPGWAWLSQIWSKVNNFFELEKWESFGEKTIAKDWIKVQWTYHNKAGSCGTHLNPYIIHLARAIERMSIV